MQHSRLLALVLALAALALSACRATTEQDLPAADLAVLDSPHVETPVRNDTLHVHHVALPPGASLAPHAGGPRLVYSIGSCTLRFEEDGTSSTQTFEAGEIHEHAAGVHDVENVGSTEAEFVVFERGDAPLPSVPTGAPIPTAGTGASVEVLFESELGEVRRITLQPGAGLPMHVGSARAVWSLTDYELEYTDEAGTRRRSYSSGDAHDHGPGRHGVENVGGTVAEFLVVEFLE